MRRYYYAAITWADWIAGQVLDEIDRLELQDSTVVVVHAVFAAGDARGDQPRLGGRVVRGDEARLAGGRRGGRNTRPP